MCADMLLGVLLLMVLSDVWIDVVSVLDDFSGMCTHFSHCARQGSCAVLLRSCAVLYCCIHFWVDYAWFSFCCWLCVWFGLFASLFMPRLLLTTTGIFCLGGARVCF